jgi:hypothetical protein
MIISTAAEQRLASSTVAGSDCIPRAVPRGFELKKPLVAKIAELLQNSLPRSC